jgi:hypothetical protein
LTKKAHLGKLRPFQQLEKLTPKESIHITKQVTGNISNERQKVGIRYKPVTWGIPFDEVVYSRWVVNLLRTSMMPWDSFSTSQATYILDARNTIHEQFLQTDCEYLVMLDSDVIPPPNFLDRLLAHHLPIVGGWYRMKADPYPPVVYDFNRIDEEGIHKYIMRKEPGTGLENVDAAGAGCWLMHRKVAEAVGPRPYSLYLGEDLEICRKIKAAGFDVFVDWDVACGHAGVAIA